MKIPFIAIGLLLTSSFCVADETETPDRINGTLNLALGKKFVSSDVNAKNWGSGLTDGSWIPGRGTTFATGDSDEFPKTVTLDLESPKKLGYVALGVPPFGSTKTVSVALSVDGTTFSDVGRATFDAAQEKKQLFNFQPVNARFIRLTYLDHHLEKHGYNPSYAFTTELEAYAPGVAPVLPPTPSLPAPADMAAPKIIEGVVSSKFLAAHEAFLKRGKAGPIGVLFIGDSITDYWRRDNAKDIWARFERYKPANFGIGGDKTQQILWRIENGELDGIKPKVVVLMIGTNNMAQYPPQEIVKADQKIVAEIHRKLPDTKILVLGIFPRGAQATHPARAKIKSINVALSKLDDGNKTRFLDIGDKFLEADGSISIETMYDALHPAPKGYQIWADAMSPLLDEMMK